MDQVPDNSEITPEKKEKQLKEKSWVKYLSLIFASVALTISILSYRYTISSFELENRAYIYVQTIFPSDIYEPFFKIKFKNFGKTPAKEIKLTQIEILTNKKLSLEQPLKQIDSSEIALLISEQERSIRIPANKTYYSIAEQQGKVFIVGKIIYKDVFDEIHSTQYAGWLRAHGENQFMNFTGNLNESD